jgi:hypothetical protein
MKKGSVLLELDYSRSDHAARCVRKTAKENLLSGLHSDLDRDVNRAAEAFLKRGGLFIRVLYHAPARNRRVGRDA